MPSGEQGVVATEPGVRRILRDRMRFSVRDDGAIERADELIGTSDQPITVVDLPTRLGGGFVFAAAHGSSKSGAGTLLYRADTWLGPLRPLAEIGVFVAEMIPGFDRLYLRLDASSKLVAIDPKNGAALSLAPLPPASVYGPLAFADGFRATVDVDLLGPLATFDGGASWGPVRLPERVAAISVLEGDPVLVTPSSTEWRVDPHGRVTRREPRAEGEMDDVQLDEPAHAGPFGAMPLRAALEDGFPDSPDTAVVARGGSLARVSLRDGAVLATKSRAYPESNAACHALALERSFGFLCGEPRGATSLYAFDPPLAMRPVWSSREPRFVAASGNGAVVIRGGCDDETRTDSDANLWCIRSATGAEREIRVRGDRGIERVVALSDGRVVVLSPPRATLPPTLSIISGDRVETRKIAWSGTSPALDRVLSQGMWLEGFEERRPGILGGWVEAGGPLVGIEIALDGKLRVGEPRAGIEEHVVFAGRFGIAEVPGNQGAETVDGGMSWRFFELPRVSPDEQASRSRACGPVGCAIERWLRVGWGDPRVPTDLKPAPLPAPLALPLTVQPTLRWTCDLNGAVTTAPAARLAPTPRASTEAKPPPLRAFRDRLAPTLSQGDVGFEHGTIRERASLRAYAWGPKGADWTKQGRWLFHFDDRFEPKSGVRSSLATPSPWPDDSQSAQGIGVSVNGGFTSLQWLTFPDVSGRSMIAASCRGAECSLFEVMENRPILPIQDESGQTDGLPRPLPMGAVRIGDAWFFAAPNAGSGATRARPDDAIALWRVEGGVARPFATLPRPITRPAAPALPALRLVRRAFDEGLGILFETPALPGERSGLLVVVPVDRSTGAAGEPSELSRRDLDGFSPRHCEASDGGWIVETNLAATTIVDLVGGQANLQPLELRLRMDPATVCVDALATTLEGTITREEGARTGSVPSGTTLWLAATERTRGEAPTGHRWGIPCRAQ